MIPTMSINVKALHHWLNPETSLGLEPVADVIGAATPFFFLFMGIELASSFRRYASDRAFWGQTHNGTVVYRVVTVWLKSLMFIYNVTRVVDPHNKARIGLQGSESV